MTKSIAVIGAGTMGSGIAQLAATRGCAVRLIDIDADVLARAGREITKHLDRSVEKRRMSAADRDAALRRITSDANIDDLDGVELVIEAIVENLDVKKKVFAMVERAAPHAAVLATNTSSLSVGKIADGVADPSRVVGMHFFNPAPIMPLVEVIASDRSSDAAVDRAFNAATEWGKTPVRAKDTPGFIVNRVARGFYLEALRLLGEGVAGVDEIDSVMKRHGGFRMGPFELMDLVGLDVNLAVSESVWDQIDRHPRFTPHDIQRRLVAQGHLGRKTGRGFYAYQHDHPLPACPVDRRSFQLNPLLSDALRMFAKRAGATDATPTGQYVFARILSAIINEAGHAYSAGVATSGDIDTAMIKGTNYPKGPLAWADEIGHRNVRGLLKNLNRAVDDDRYAPAPLFANAG
jgi:3-hydroxybutyryl-CoA dehydrogenase